MVEAFTAEHDVSINEALFDWPASKFQAIYDAFARRKIADDLSNRRSLEVAAVWGNPNLDTDKANENPRADFMKSIDERFSIAIMKLYGQEIDEEEEFDEGDQFIAAMKRGIEKKKLPDPKVNDA